MNKMRRRTAQLKTSVNPIPSSPGYGNKPLAEPTRSGFDGKAPSPISNYSKTGFESPEWMKIQTKLKKKGASFYE